MQNYRKLIAAFVGLAVLIAGRKWGFSIPGLDEAITEVIVGALTLLAVERLPNTPKAEQP